MILNSFKYAFLLVSVLMLYPFLVGERLQAQDDSTGLFILKGRILTSDSLLPVHNAHVISKFNRWGTISNEHGDFKMLVHQKDSLLITSIGMSAMILHLTDSIEQSESPLTIYMVKDTIYINEFIVHAFWEYETFKQMIIEMKPIDFDFSRLNFSENMTLAMPVDGQTGLSPVQAMYNRFNREERLKRTLIKNRAKYNQLMIDMGRPQDTIPAKPEHMQESQDLR